MRVWFVNCGVRKKLGRCEGGKEDCEKGDREVSREGDVVGG